MSPNWNGISSSTIRELAQDKKKEYRERIETLARYTIYCLHEKLKQYNLDSSDDIPYPLCFVIFDKKTIRGFNKDTPEQEAAAVNWACNSLRRSGWDAAVKTSADKLVIEIRGTLPCPTIKQWCQRMITSLRKWLVELLGGELK